MFVFMSVIVIGFNPYFYTRVTILIFTPATIIERKINIAHMLNHIHGTGKVLAR